MSNYGVVIDYRDMIEVAIAAHEITRDPKVRRYLAELNRKTDKSNFKANDFLESEICKYSNGRLIHVSAETNGTQNNLIGGDCYLEYKRGGEIRRIKVDIKNSDKPGLCGCIDENSIYQEFDVVYLTFEQAYKKYFITSRFTLKYYLGDLIHLYKDEHSDKRYLAYKEYRKLLDDKFAFCLERIMEE